MADVKKGRNPSKAGSENVLLRLEPTYIAKIDDLRRISPDLPSRQEVIRRILADVLFVKGEAKPPPDDPTN